MNKADMIYDLSVIWSAVKEEFPYFDRLSFDWDEHYRTCLEQLLSIESEAAFHQLLSDFMERLNDGHTKYIPPREYNTRPPFVPPEPPSHAVQDGVLTIKINDFLRDHAPLVREWLQSAPGVSLVRLDITDNIGGNTFYAANVAELFISGLFHGCQKWTQVRNAVDAASLSQIACLGEDRLRQYMEDGLVEEEELEEARKTMGRTKYETYMDSFGAEGHEALYAGPLHILISGRTMSAAEDFTAMFKSNHRGVLIGEPTYGSTGTPYMIQLRCGGRAQVVSVGYRLLDGTEFIGRGIQPDRPSEVD